MQNYDNLRKLQPETISNPDDGASLAINRYRLFFDAAFISAFQRRLPLWIRQARTLTALFLLFAQSVIWTVSAQTINDANFANAIRTKCPTCIDANNILLPPAANLVTLHAENSNISDLTGIGGFTNLDTLYCFSNNLVALPTLPGNLKLLNCVNNQLMALPNLPGGLTRLLCQYNNLTALPVLPAGFQRLICNNNQLNSLPSLPAGMDLLVCDNNNFSALPNLPKGIGYLSCSFNKLTSLPALPDSLGSLFCAFNKLTALPSLPDSLKGINCSSNALTALPPLPNALVGLVCGLNNISCLPTLPASLRFLSIDPDKIACLPNIPPNLTVKNASFQNIPTPPLCVMVTTDPAAPAGIVCAGQPATFTAKATGTGTLSVKWQKKGAQEAGFSDIANTSTTYTSKSNATYKTPNLAATDNGASYRAVFTSNCSGLVVTSAAVVSVGDNMPPFITNCPTNLIIPATSFCAVANWPTIKATDNCGTPTVMGNYNSGTCFPLGMTTVKYKATDGSGNQSACSFTVTVNCSDAFDPNKCYQIVNKQTHKLLTDNSVVPPYFPLIVQATANNGGNQKWNLPSAGAPYVKLSSTQTGKVAAANILVYSRSYFPGGSGDWKMECTNNSGYYKITQRQSGQVLDGRLDAAFSAAGVASPTPVLALPSNGSDYQQWSFVETPCVNACLTTCISVNPLAAKTDNPTIETSPDFTIYPNPANNEAWIDLKNYRELEGSDATLTLTDMLGRTVQQAIIPNAGSASYRLDVAHLLSGVYLVKLQSPATAPIIKKLQITR